MQPGYTILNKNVITDELIDKALIDISTSGHFDGNKFYLFVRKIESNHYQIWYTDYKHEDINDVFLPDKFTITQLRKYSKKISTEILNIISTF